MTIVVAIPARNERENIRTCLASIALAAQGCPARVVIAVGADACRDDTAAAARAVAHGDVELIVTEGQWRAAGRARAAAVATAMERCHGVDASTVWIANTDADCVVGPAWLQRQLDYANAGAHAVAGIVSLDAHATPDHLQAMFAATYHCGGPTHRHVHAANLGVRADAYDLVGGWSTHTMIGEDHELWSRLRRVGPNIAQPTDLSVVTSSRTIGRLRGGFASTLARMERDIPRPQRTAS